MLNTLSQLMMESGHWNDEWEADEFWGLLKLPCWSLLLLLGKWA